MGTTISLRKRAAKFNTNLISAVKSEGSKRESFEDERYWKPFVDTKTGNGFAVIRFLPPKEGEDLPFVKLWSHGFQGENGLWYIENSLTSLGQEDPVSKANSILWESGDEQKKELARARKRRLHYVSNIMVISDPANPENNGKVFLFQYGKKIFEKLVAPLSFDESIGDDPPFNPFDFWEGANFKLKIRKFEGYRNYDNSDFENPAPLLDGSEEKLEVVYNNLYSLQDEIAPEKFKTYAELEAKFNRVTGVTGSAGIMNIAAETVSQRMDNMEERQLTTKGAAVDKLPVVDDDEDDEGMEYFKKLAAST